MGITDSDSGGRVHLRLRVQPSQSLDRAGTRKTAWTADQPCELNVCYVRTYSANMFPSLPLRINSFFEKPILFFSLMAECFLYSDAVPVLVLYAIYYVFSHCKALLHKHTYMIKNVINQIKHKHMCIYILLPPKWLCFRLRLFVCWQNYSTTYGRISMTFLPQVGIGQRNTP